MILSTPTSKSGIRRKRCGLSPGSLGHVHISENDRGIPGTGHNDWPGVLKALKDIGYNGWMTIESFAQPEPDLAAAAAIWRDIAPSGDELAQQGLRFIRGLAKEVGIK